MKLKLKNTILFAAFVCGLIVCSKTAASAQEYNDATVHNVPGLTGSFLKSCSDPVSKIIPIALKGATIVAACNPKSSGTAAPTNHLTDVFECDGDIWNDDGFLKCNRNENSALMQNAKQAMDYAYKNIYGGGMPSWGYKVYLREMFKAGYAPEFYAGTLNGFSDAKHKTASDFFSNYLNSTAHASDKAAVIEKAFTDVYGYGVSPKDLAFYNAQKVAYADVVKAEKKKLVADKVIHRLAIAAAYQKTMGRTAAPGDFGFWEPRGETYKEIIDVNRAYLYSSNGAKDLTETVKRHLEDVGKSNPSIAEINQAIVRYSQKKAVYDEMK